ncbi:hypothetical protein A3K72_01015 [Candidatus Woesearchaeota archaeon RBG_13_36_6]|nr:MAG: hypothetical protein A3K72_01015 [Candidatus Woesearchaeota archaeon RBG_13_36_6]
MGRKGNINRIIKIENKIRRIFLSHYKNSSAGAYQLKSNLNVYRFRRQILKCVEVIPKNSSVLEVGCGCGYVLCMLKELRPDIKIQGSDISPSSTWKMLKKRGLRLIRDDATKSGFPSNKFDVVVSFGVMEHASNDLAFLKEIYRVLKSGGLSLMFNLPNKYALNDFLARRFKIGGHKQRYTKKQIIALFKEHGFENIIAEKEFLIPAQVNRISGRLDNFFNKHYEAIDGLDDLLMKTYLSVLAQTYFINSKKPSRNG